MRHSTLKKICSCILVLSIALPSFAQYSGFGSSRYGSMNSMNDRWRLIESYRRKKENGDNVDGFYRSQGSIQFAPVTAIYRLEYTYQGTNSTGTGTTYFSGEVESKVSGMAYGAGGEHYFPLGKTSDNSVMALTIGGDVMLMSLTAKEIRLNGGLTFTPELQYMQGNLPIGIVYKSGTDVVFRKSVKSGFSFGGGVSGNMTMTYSNFDNFFPALGYRPYCMAEVSFFAGICWKIRGTAYLSNTLLERGVQAIGSDYDTKEETDMSVKSRPGVMLSLAIGDFSWDWDED